MKLRSHEDLLEAREELRRFIMAPELRRLLEKYLREWATPKLLLAMGSEATSLLYDTLPWARGLVRVGAEMSDSRKVWVGYVGLTNEGVAIIGQ